jgi:hypothetical protein
MNKLEMIMELMDVFQNCFPEETRLALFDKEKLIAELPVPSLNWHMPIGTPFSEMQGTASYKALTEQRIVFEERTAEQSMSGVAYISKAVPIYENGELLGVLTALVSNQRLDTMRTGATQLAVSVEKMTASTQEIGQASNNLSAQLQDIFAKSEDIKKDLEKSSSILKAVQEIADNSQLLGLNAAIEAARIGEEGRGFEVVATEIRKMADYSKTMAIDIQIQLQQIREAVDKMHESIQQVAAFTDKHAYGIREINEVCEGIMKTAEDLLHSAEL